MRICFYFEYKNIVGGLTSLLLTLIKELRRKNVEVVLFNYRDGLVAKELEKSNTKIILIDIDEINWKDIDTLISDEDVFVISAFSEIFYKFFKVNPKMVYYNINDYLGEISQYKFGINPKSFARKLIHKLIDENALLLMDDTGIRRAGERLNYDIKKPSFLPIPVAVPEINFYDKKVTENNGPLKLTYIGRSVDWKMYPLKKILDDLKGLGTERPSIIFTIVVDSLINFRKFIKVEDYTIQKGFEIIVHEQIPPSQIDSLLLNESHLNFAMGTSALESAKLGIPTILIDFSKKEFPNDYKYQWLHQTRFFGLGKDVENNYIAPVNGMDMRMLISKINNDHQYFDFQSTENYRYVKDHHSVENVVDLLIQYAQKTRFRFLSAKPYILYYSQFHRSIKRLIKGIAMTQ